MAQTWIGLVVVVVVAQFGLTPLGLSLKSVEFVAVVSSGTVSVIGLWWQVGRGVFSPPATKSNDAT